MAEVKQITTNALRDIYESARKLADNEPELDASEKETTEVDEFGLPVDGGEIPFRPDDSEEEASEEKEEKPKEPESQKQEALELSDDTIVKVKVDGKLVEKKFGEVRSDYAGREMITRKSQELSERMDFLNQQIAKFENIVKQKEGKGEQPDSEPKQPRLKRFTLEDFGVDPNDPLIDTSSYKNMIDKMNEQQEQIENVLEFVDHTKTKDTELQEMERINNTNKLVEEASKKENAVITLKMAPLVHNFVEMAKRQARIEPNRGWENYTAEHAIKDVDVLVRDALQNRKITEADIPKEVMDKLYEKWKETMSGTDPTFKANRKIAANPKEIEELEKKIIKPGSIPVEGGIHFLNENVRKSVRESGGF